MPIGHDGRMQARRRARARAVARRKMRRARLIALLLVLLPCVLLLASTVSASASSESSLAERQARAAVKAAEHLARHEAKQAAIQAKREANLRARQERAELRHPNGSVVIGCNQVTLNYKGFPDAPGNTVAQQLTFDHDHSTRQSSTFTFDGPTGSTVTPLDGHAGRYQIDAWAVFTIDGVKLHFDIYKKVTCPPVPGLSIEKLQRIGSETAYTPATLTGEVGQTVEYEMVVKNTGNIAAHAERAQRPALRRRHDRRRTGRRHAGDRRSEHLHVHAPAQHCRPDGRLLHQHRQRHGHARRRRLTGDAANRTRSS